MPAVPASTSHVPCSMASMLQALPEAREENERMFKLVNEGNGILSDATKRRKYDAGYTLEEIEQVGSLSLCDDWLHKYYSDGDRSTSRG